MRNKGFVILILLVAVVAGPTFAEEVIYFTNGTEMAIRAHKVEGDLIKVDLGDNGFMAFPKSVVEKIEEVSDVILMPSTVSNTMFKSDPSTRVYGTAPRAASTSWALPQQMDMSENEQEMTTRVIGGVPTKPLTREEARSGGAALRVPSAPVAYDEDFKAAAQIPGAKQRIPTSSLVKKKVLVELDSGD